MNDEHKTFIRWLARFAGCGSYAPGFHAWNWRIGGVLVTLWMGNSIVKIYHEQGRRTNWHPFNTERCREDVLSLLNDAGLTAAPNQSKSQP
jgi:hypothetical protein